MSDRPRKSDFIKALKDIVEERSARGEAVDPDAMLDAAADRLGVTLVRSTFVPERVPAPFPAPDGFDYPLVPPRPTSPRRKATLIAQLQAKRPEARRLAVAFLGRSMDDPLVVDAIRVASVDDPDPYVRGSALVLLGLATTDHPETLLAGARRLVEDAPLAKTGTWASDMAREGAAQGVFGALLAAVRAGRHDLGAELRTLSESLDPRITSTGSDLPARQQSSLLKLIDEFERPPSR